MNNTIQYIILAYVLIGLFWTIARGHIFEDIKDIKIIDIISMVIFLPYTAMLLLVVLLVYLLNMFLNTNVWEFLNRNVFK